MVIFARVDCDNYVAYFAGKRLGSVGRDLRKNFSRNYKQSTLVKVDENEIIEMYQKKFGEKGAQMARKDISVAESSINKKTASFCIRHFKRELLEDRL